MKRRKTLKLFAAVVVAALIGVAGIPELSFAQDRKKMVTVVKIAGIPWFNALENGVKWAAKDFGIDASTVGPSHLDGVEIPDLGKAVVDVDNKQIKVEKIISVNKDTLDGLIKQGL